MYALQFRKPTLEISKLREERANEKKKEALCDRTIALARMRQRPMALFQESELCDLLSEPLLEIMKALLSLTAQWNGQQYGTGLLDDQILT
jgi:hypothetical protein